MQSIKIHILKNLLTKMQVYSKELINNKGISIKTKKIYRRNSNFHAFKQEEHHKQESEKPSPIQKKDHLKLKFH